MIGLLAIDQYEEPLAAHLRNGLSAINGITLYGPPEGHPRTSTISFTHEEFPANLIARFLNEYRILVWDGDFFATVLVECLGLSDRGGLVRIGIAPYNTRSEIDKTLELLRDTQLIRRYRETEQATAMKDH